ncbi:MAG: DUF3846 domain-containing protein [Saccharofermentanales bacterium]
MANYVKNILTFEDVTEEKLSEIYEAIMNEEFGLGSIDFNKIIPMPIDTANPETEFSEKSQSWSIKNWGTKWNAFGFDIENASSYPSYDAYANVIEFNTAWSPPIPIIEKLASLHPDVLIKHLWADEDFGYNVGICEYQNGELIFENIPSGGSRESYELASQIIGYSLKELGYQLTPGGTNYEYLEEDMETKYKKEEIIPKGSDHRIIEMMQLFAEAGDMISYEEAEEVYQNEVDFGEIEKEDIGMKDYYETSDGSMEVPEIVDEFFKEIKTKKIRVVLVQPMRKPNIIEIGSDLKSMQAAVNGLIEEVSLYDDDISLICNEEGKILGLPLCRTLKYENGEVMDIIAGDFFICGNDGERFSSLTEEQAQRYAELFRIPEAFVRTENGIIGIPMF